MSYSNYYSNSHLFHGSQEVLMGTQFDVLMIGADEDRLKAVWNDLVVELKRLDRMMSRYDKEGELALVNRDAFVRPVELSDELWNILQDCWKYWDLTDHLFDITMQDFSRVILSDENNFKDVRFTSADIQLDLGGYGKGYALSVICKMLMENDVTQALVNFGNSAVLALGNHPQGDYWPVGINNPYTSQALANFHLKDSSLSVSGNMPSHSKHIVNPESGKFEERRRLTAVVSVNPIDAEVLSTVFMVATEQQIDSIAAKFDLIEKQIYEI